MFNAINYKIPMYEWHVRKLGPHGGMMGPVEIWFMANPHSHSNLLEYFRATLRDIDPSYRLIRFRRVAVKWKQKERIS